MSFTAFGRGYDQNASSAAGSHGTEHNGATTHGHAAFNGNGHAHVNGNGHTHLNGNGHANGNGHSNGHAAEPNGNINGNGKSASMGSRFQRIHTTLSSGVSIKGTVKFRSELTIDGEVEGTIQSFGRLTVGRNAHVRGDIQSRSVTVHGTVDGNLSVDEQCELRSGCTLRGDIETSRLIVDEDVNFTGNAAIATRDLLSELRPFTREENGNGHNPA